MIRHGEASSAGEPVLGGKSIETGTAPRCYLCGTDVGLTYCSFCSKHFCAECERKYPTRVVAATLEGFSALKALLLSALPPDPSDSTAPPIEPSTVPQKGPSPKDGLCCGQRHR
jgi:hypothetical protein